MISINLAYMQSDCITAVLKLAYSKICLWVNVFQFKLKAYKYVLSILSKSTKNNLVTIRYNQLRNTSFQKRIF